MATAHSSNKPSFFKTHVLPVLFVFLIPGFSAWFFSYAEGWMDRIILPQVEGSIRADVKTPEEEKADMLEFYRQVPVSRIMASNNPQLAPVQEMFEPVKWRYAAFRWMKRIAWLCLGTIAATFLIVGLSVALSFRSHAAQYYALRIGWPVLRTSAAIQVVGQGILAVMLSFWVTAIAADSYYIKLIGMIGILALLAIASLLTAIFARTNDRCEVDGELISEADAPTLWQRVREMAGRLDTSSPDQIVVGIEPNFFVTEHPVLLGSQILEGRTLYLSLPILKVLAVDEADAVLGHELAHFSGEDTLWSRKISPLTGKFSLYLQALGQGFSLIVAHFMHLFWKLYGLSINRLSRAREFRADQIGANLSSNEAMKRALVKITCYCEFRAKTEQRVIEKKEVDENLQLAAQLEQAYPAFLASFSQDREAVNERIPHPFDSHPTLNSRLSGLGFEAQAALADRAIQQAAEHSWYQAIATAPVLEEKMWAARQDAIQNYHRQSVLWQLSPENQADEELLRKEFPRLVFRRKDGAEAILDFDRLQIPEHSSAILFKDISYPIFDNVFLRRRVTLVHRPSPGAKEIRTRFYPSRYKSTTGEFLADFWRYYSRHQNAANAKAALSI